ncbi:MAG: diguanylate cyclase [Ahrensia sp.]
MADSLGIGEVTMIIGSIDANLIDKLLPPFVLGVFAIAFFMLWFNRRQFSSALVLSLSYAAGMVAFGLEASYGIYAIAGPVPFFGDVLYTVSAALFSVAVAVRFGGRSIHKLAASIVVIAAVGHGYYRFIDPDLSMRVEIISFSCVILLCLSLGVLAQNIRRASALLLCGQVIILAFALVMSTVFTVDPAGNGISESALRNSLYMSLINMTVTAASLTAAVTLYMSYVTCIVDELRMQSETDPLTGLLNRRGFEMRAATLFEEHRQLPLVMIVADIDFFKQINDAHGHTTGDKVLRHLARLMRDGVRQSDLCGRIGGEEFCIIMPGAQLPVGKLAAENMRSVFAQTAKILVGLDKPLTASFGVCEARDGESYHALFERTDAALYAAKNNGRDQVCTRSFPMAAIYDASRARA